MGEIYLLVYESKKGNKEKVIDLIHKFDSLLNKLQRNSHYEDMKNDLVLFLLRLISRVPIEVENFKDDKYITSYIYKSIKNEYIRLNKKIQERHNNELYLNESIINNKQNEQFDKVMLNDMMKILTEKEKEIISKIYINGFTEAQIGRDKKISRQAVHKTHERALKKLRLHYNHLI